MSRYIDADKLALFIVEHLPRSAPQDAYDAYFDVMRMLKDERATPTADVEEVRHGKDIYYTKNDKHCEFKCSVCNAWIGVVEGGTATLDAARGFNYCPACGAKMDKEKEQ